MKKCLAALAATAALACTMPTTKPPANGTLFAGATVVAGAQQTPQRDYAIYIEGDRIVDVGSSVDLEKKYSAARVIDLAGATVLPGLTDAHAHLYGLGLSLDTVNLVGSGSIDEIVSRMRDRVARAGAGDWVLGRGWDQNRWPQKQFPTVAPLDALSADKPIWLKRVDGHAGWTNTAGLRAAGITASTPDPEGGRILRDASGNPTGVFIDAAQHLIESRIPEPTQAQRKARVKAAAENIAAHGLTEIHDAGADPGTIAAVKALIDEHAFPIRCYTMIADDADQLRDWFGKGKLVNYGGRLTVRSVKLYADGALGSRGALLLAPYSDDPSNSGLVVSTEQHMADVAKRARAAGFQVNTHAIGDRAVRNVIEAYEDAGVTSFDRFRIEHFQIVAPEDFARAAKDSIIASMQPTHATSDMPWAEARVGPERIRGAYAWRTVLNSKGRLAFGSDFPVEDVNPFYGIHSAVTRQDQKGNPPGGWYPDQKLTLAEAIRGFTIDAAYAAFEEDSRGTIQAGKLADFTIVDGDFFNAPQSEIFKTKVRMTVVGGDIAYGARF